MLICRTMNEYLRRNALGYEGDTFIHEEIKGLIKEFGIEVIVETGTYLGATTRRFLEFGIPVYSFEIDPENYSKATTVAKGAKIYQMDSVDGLKTYLPEIKDKKILFFLDAHWEKHCPLLDELALIAQHGIKPVIIIHDFKVPGKDFGFDSYNGQDFEFEWIRPALEKIYPQFTYYYNHKANGAKRGVIYIHP